MNLRKDHYRAKKTLVKFTKRAVTGSPPARPNPDKGWCPGTGPVVGYPAVHDCPFPGLPGFSDASKGGTELLG